MLKIHDTQLKIVSLILLGASAIAIIALNFFIYPSFTKMVIDETESKSVMVAEHLSSMLVPKGSELFITHKVQAQTKRIHTFIKEFSLNKLKILVASGEIIFSSDQEDIGVFNNHDYFHNEVASGNIYTKLVHKNDKSLEGQKLESDTVETYVPIMHGKKFIGALEIYYDVTPQTTVIRNNIILFNTLTIGLFSTFLLICLVVILKLDKYIVEKKMSQDFLKMTNLDLKREIEQRLSAEKAKEDLILELEDALVKLKILKGLVPICSFCKNIRNDSGFWEQMESYIEKHSDAEFSHGLCPDCAAKHYPELHLDKDDDDYAQQMEKQQNQSGNES